MQMAGIASLITYCLTLQVVPVEGFSTKELGGQSRHLRRGRIDEATLAVEAHRLNGTIWLARAASHHMLGGHEFAGTRGSHAREIASFAEFDEDGYLAVAKLEKNSEMELYIRRVVRSLGLAIRDESGLQGLLPHYSGVKAMQTYFSLKQELIGVAANPNGWLVDGSEQKEDSVFLAQMKTDAQKKWNGKTAPLGQKGYEAVAALKDDRQMTRFIRRTVRELGLLVSDEGRLQGIVPYYSGTKDVQNFAKLRKELFGAVRVQNSWVASGETAVLTENGYKSVAALLDDHEMAIFVKRVARHHGCTVVDEDALKTIVPLFSGTLSVQSLALLSQEIREGCGLASTEEHYGSMHDIVGKDGVLQIRMAGSTRYKYSAEELRSAGVITTEFAATNAKEASPAQLAESCPLMSNATTFKTCRKKERQLKATFNLGNQTGCRSKTEQAITDSHRRALQAALERNESDWTAILEDDVVPLHPGFFDASFKAAWAKLPNEAKMVRLSWCTFEQDLGSIRKKTFRSAGNFRLIKYMSWEDGGGVSHYYTGGCTTGYLVHRSLLPEMLGIFPCCCPIDCCLERQFFYTPPKPDGPQATWRGEQIMINMEAWDSKEDSFNYTTFNQGGVFVQDNRDIRSLRPEWMSSDADL